MRLHRQYYLLSLLLLLNACASLGLAPAQSFDQKLAYGYATHTAVLLAANTSLQAGSITKADAQQVLTLGDTSKTLLDSAKAIETTDPVGATNKLALATAVLVQIQSYLNAKRSTH